MDLDPRRVSATKMMKEIFRGQETANWKVVNKSILDKEFVKSLENSSGMWSDEIESRRWV